MTQQNENSGAGSPLPSTSGSTKRRIDRLSDKAKRWLHNACNQLADAGEYIDDPDSRNECEDADLLIYFPKSRKIDLHPDVMTIVYTGGYLSNKE